MTRDTRRLGPEPPHLPVNLCDLAGHQRPCGQLGTDSILAALNGRRLCGRFSMPTVAQAARAVNSD